MKPAVILVGADKGGVGKTTISRAILDYLTTKSINARAFDTETPRGALHRFHPHETSIVDITETGDQMKILDTLNDSAAKASVIDVRAGQMTETLKVLRDVGFLDAVQDGQFTFVIIHVLGPSVSSLGEIADMAPFVKDAHYFLAKNHVNDTTFFEWDPKSYASYFGDVECAGEITIPKLDEMAYEQVELNGVSFADFVSGKQGSFVLRGYVRTWLRNVCEELDSIGLHILIAPELRRQ